ncbi:MAG TPA: L-threonylcarbamoyladenylate synthase [Polyangiaceae bacterium]|jgi:L-threonylcarbamoyladenylate synthase|nr:L-threonylcarbamoyladenylate synthase [Polyangiaceae bacterium]
MPIVLALDLLAPGPSTRNAEALAEAARVLRGGGLVAFPTETVYGLGARALDPRALARIFEAKGRPSHHPLIAHVIDEARARELAASWPAVASRLAAASWPGPLTLVLDRAPHVPGAIAAGTSSIAVRVPANPVARALLEALGEPIAAPSANRYQGVSPTTAAHVVKELGDGVDLVLDGGPCEVGIESTVIDVRGDPPSVLRLGAAHLASLRAAIPGLRVAARGAIEAEARRASPGMDARHYAPRARVVLVAGRDEALRVASASASARSGLIVRGPVPDESGVLVRVLADDPVLYARDLYAALHALDDAQVTEIVIECVPSDERWMAVGDRLQRASTPR